MAVPSSETTSFFADSLGVTSYGCFGSAGVSAKEYQEEEEEEEEEGGIVSHGGRLKQ